MALFPKWTNSLPAVTLFVLGVFATGVVACVWTYFTPAYWEVGYQPEQPISYSHQIHVQKLGMDCMYCHTHVGESKAANVPAASTCMNCHTVVDSKTGYLRKANSVDGIVDSAHWVNPNLATVRRAYLGGEAIEWKRVHMLPDYVQFNHAAHVNAGVSCFSCHGRIDQMAVVYQKQSLSMSWCLDCHRAPEKALLNTAQGKVTDLAWAQDTLSERNYADRVGRDLAERLKAVSRFSPPQHCGACHY